MNKSSSTRTTISRFVTLFLVVACVVVSRAQEPTLPIIWSSQLPWCCEKVVANPDDEFVYYKYRNFIGQVRASDGMFLDSILVPDDSVINMDETYGLFHLRTRSQLIAVGDGIPRYDDKVRGMIQIYDVPQMRHNRSILIPKWWPYSNQGSITGPSCISSDERYIAITGRHEINRIYVYDLNTREMVWMHEGMEQEQLGASFTRDSNRLMISKYVFNQGGTSVSCWDPITNTMLWEKVITSRFKEYNQFTNDGKRIVVNYSGHLGVYTYPELTTLYRSDTDAGDFIPNDDGSLILLRFGVTTGTKTLRVETGDIKTLDSVGVLLTAVPSWNQMYVATIQAMGRLYKVNVDWSVGVNETTDTVRQTISPNPCNTETHVTFSTAAAQPVLITVHDSSGRLLSRQYDSMLESGNHVVNIDCSTLPAGICFVRLVIGSETTTLPLMIEKGSAVK
ncbi:MAG: T9SS type A sorting domain-containing protein [Deltaproteobacteria bacterium]|nr:T9SS type A sorting domain-containing protein [Candidatus Kapabacteria bacterium]